MKNIKKLIIEDINEDCCGTLELLPRLSSDPYDYQEITDNLSSFKIRNKGK
jgi:hypothetical protein